MQILPTGWGLMGTAGWDLPKLLQKSQASQPVKNNSERNGTKVIPVCDFIRLRPQPRDVEVREVAGDPVISPSLFRVSH